MRLGYGVLVCIGVAGAAAACTDKSGTADEAERPATHYDSGSRNPLEPELVEFPGDGRALYGYLYRPSGDGPFPAIVFNHGSEKEPWLKTGQARFYVPQGFVLFMPHRRGHGESQQSGEYIVDIWNKSGNDPVVLVQELDAHLDDVTAAIAYIRERSFVDAKRIAVVGCSFGGIMSLLAAEREKDLAAAIDFAGASYMWARSVPLQERMKRAARNAKVPVFFLQAENDRDTTPSKVLYRELGAVKRRSRMRIFPPHGKSTRDGHGFCGGGEHPPWGEDVLEFLQETMGVQ